MPETAKPKGSSGSHSMAGCLVVLVVVVTVLFSVFSQRKEGAFHVFLDKDGVTGEIHGSIVGIPVDYREGRSADNLTFGAACLPDDLNVSVRWGKPFEGDRDGRVLVRYRFDDRPSPDPMRWEMFASSEAAWMPKHLVGGFVAEARTAQTLVLRVVDPLDGESITNTFSLEGFGAALDRILPCR